MLRELEDGLVEIGESEVQSIRERVQQEEVSEEEGAEEEAEVRVTTRKKVEELYSIFAIADPMNMQRRVRILSLCNPFLKLPAPFLTTCIPLSTCFAHTPSSKSPTT